MKKPLILAPKVTFKEEDHEYHLNGKQLSGITRLIAKRMNIRMPEDFVGEARTEGLHIHKAVQDWLTKGTWESIHPGALFVKKYMETQCRNPPEVCHAEILVSDMKQYASSVDIIKVNEDDSFTLYDIKRSFKRPYVTWQLSIYKYFIQKMFPDRKIGQLYCIAVKDKCVYPVFPFSVADVEELLYGTAKI